MARLGGEALGGTVTDEQLRDLLADTARTLAATLEDAYRELYPPEPVPEEGVGIGPDSPTAEVVSWVETRGMAASAQVRGAWVWLEGRSAVPERLELVVQAAGFRWSDKRRSWFHICGTPSKGSAAGKPLSRYHGVSTVESFKAGSHKADPAWLVTKQAKAKRRKALQGNGPVPAFGA